MAAVVGSSGFVGAELVQYLLDTEAYEFVVGLDLSPSSRNVGRCRVAGKRLKLRLVDITSGVDELARELQGCEVAFFHRDTNPNPNPNWSA